jgi:DNA-binding CsgD family transcriptional regulator/PAS domain-containing protein
MAESLDALETIDLLYQAAIDPALWPDALDRLSRATGGVGTAMIPITPQNTAGLVVSPALQEANVDYEREWWQYDTRVLRIFSRKLKGGVCCEAELFTDEEVARDPLRQEFLRAWGIGAFAAQLVTPLPNFVVAFSVQRALKRGQFEKRELATLGLLGRHAARALLISAHLGRAKSTGRVLSETLEQLQCGALIVDSTLHILHANGAAERMIGDGLAFRHGQLTASSPAEQRRFQHFLRLALCGGGEEQDGGPIALTRPGGGRPLIAQAVPVSPRRAEASDWFLPASAAALVLVVDPDEQAASALATALSLFGLTHAESRLAALIGEGRSRREAAEALGISELTASDALKRIYAKLDIKRQSELVHLVDRLAMLPSRGKKGAAGGFMLACTTLLSASFEAVYPGYLCLLA